MGETLVEDGEREEEDEGCWMDCILDRGRSTTVFRETDID